MRNWTEEAKRRQAEAIGTWRPWACSTGPQSDHGKACAAANSYKHGLRSAEGRALLALMRRQDRLRRCHSAAAPSISAR